VPVTAGTVGRGIKRSSGQTALARKGRGGKADQQEPREFGLPGAESSGELRWFREGRLKGEPVSRLPISRLAVHAATNDGHLHFDITSPRLGARPTRAWGRKAKEFPTFQPRLEGGKPFSANLRLSWGWFDQSMGPSPRKRGIGMTSALQPKSVDELVVFVVKHPIRVDALQILNEREASASEIARQIGQDLKKVSNHIKALADHGCIELVRTVQKRGAAEHFYRASLRPHIGDEEWAELSQQARHEISALVFQAIVAEALSAFRAGKFDSRLDRFLAWQPMKLDEQGWQELKHELDESLERIQEIAARADERLCLAGEKGFPAVAAAMSFERAMAGRARSSEFALPPMQ
jgi:DNA-binding transcriptional ArsR family regulator